MKRYIDCDLKIMAAAVYIQAKHLYFTSRIDFGSKMRTDLDQIRERMMQEPSPDTIRQQLDQWRQQYYWAIELIFTGDCEYCRWRLDQITSYIDHH